jgi:hypothetical protein
MSNFATFDAQASKLPQSPAQLPSTKPATDVLNYLFVLVVLVGVGYFVYRTVTNGAAAAATAPLPIPDPGDWMREWKPWIRGATV